MSDDQNKRVNEHSKDEQLEQYRTDNSGKKMTTNQACECQRMSTR